MKNKEFYEIAKPTWCLGCGLYGIFEALKRAAASLDIAPEEMVIVTGIGCHGRLPNYFRSYGFHGLHGRSMPVAQGAKLSNPNLAVIGISGDGDAYSIGLGHFLHALRRNVGITYLVVNNRVYALTEGQTSPTSPTGYVSISSPKGSKEYPLDGAQLAFAAGGTFIARGFSGEMAHLTNLIEKGLKHKGFALIDILSPCITYNKVNTYDWYKKNIFLLEAEPDYNPKDKPQACEMLTRTDKIPLGIIYLEERPAYESLVLPDRSSPIGTRQLEIDRPGLEKIMEKFN
jgi:2-oxoglutarate ferredoxin oxidoreductase subunit beta